MQLHTLKNPRHNKAKKRVGRGGRRGSYSGRGIKGQKARAGRKIRPDTRDLIKKIPMRRGENYTGPPNTEVSLSAAIIAKHFDKGGRVTPALLLRKKLIRRIRGKVPSVKILAPGNHLEGLDVHDCKITGQKKKQ